MLLRWVSDLLSAPYSVGNLEPLPITSLVKERRLHYLLRINIFMP